MWYLNLDEIEGIAKKILLVGNNRFNYYSFYDKEHLQYDNKKQSLKEQILSYAKAHDASIDIRRVMLLTNLKTLGYQFNPVSFYYCFDKDDIPVCAIAEVGNTFGEMKPYYLGKEHLTNGVFRKRTKKLFYVSPFIDHTIDFDFVLPVPNKLLNIRIDDYQEGRNFFTAILQGKTKKLTNANVLISALQFPLITIKIIFLIHYQAFKIWMCKIPYHKKTDYPEQQVGVYKAYKN